MQVKYIWRTINGYENTNIFDNLKDCKKDCKNVLQDITNQGGYPRFFKNHISQITENTTITRSFLCDAKPIIYDLFLKPNKIIHPPQFRYIDYKGEWKIYGNYDESKTVNVYSHFGLPNKVNKKPTPRLQLKDNNFDKYIYDIVSIKPNIFEEFGRYGHVHINDFKLYQYGDKIKALHNGKYKTFKVHHANSRIASIKPLKNYRKHKDILLLYNDKDQYLVDKLTPSLQYNNINVKHNEQNEIKYKYDSSSQFDAYINDCNVIIYTKNTINDPDLNLKIGTILTMDLPIYVIYVEIPHLSSLDSNTSVSSVLYPEEIHQIISSINKQIYGWTHFIEYITHLTQYPIDNAYKLFINKYERDWLKPNLIQLIYNRYNNEYLQDSKTLKIIDKTINDNKHVIPKSLYNQIIKDAKQKNVRMCNHGLRK